MILGGSDSEDEDSKSDQGGVSLVRNGDGPAQNDEFKINTDYAARFLHNKKREELHRCRNLFSENWLNIYLLKFFTVEEKYGQSANPRKRKSGAMDNSNDRMASGSNSSSSTDEDEDDEGILATTQLDEEISATLKAIKSKDPRVYQPDVTFYSKFDDNDDDARQEDVKKEKPIYIRDYHREQLLKGANYIRRER